jgi:AmmeMemoRadiSam system protein B/AmmeMemoRadiSam system protein A
MSGKFSATVFIALFSVGLSALSLTIGCTVQEQATSSPQNVSAQNSTQEQALRIHRCANTIEWFPNNRQELENDLKKYLAAAPEPKLDQPLAALIVPHAGYSLSGWTQAHAYRQLAAEAERIQRVIILAFSHRYPIEGASVLDVDAYETPLGRIPTDQQVIEALLKSKHFTSLPAAHLTEHSDENQLPFLQHVLKDFRMVSIYVGATSEAQRAELADAIRPFVDEHTALVVSSDFTHYGAQFQYLPFRTDVKKNMHALDRKAIDRIVALDCAGFLEHVRINKATICGSQPIALLLHILHGDIQGRFLHYETSSDRTGGDYSTAVGYAALIFTGKVRQTMGIPIDGAEAGARASYELNEAEKKTLLVLARRTIQAHFANRKPDLADLDITPTMKATMSCFVTLKKQGELRGCIGNLSANQPLYQDVIDYAIKSAFGDPRFPALKEDELAECTIEISALTPPAPITKIEDIVIGKHGLTIEKGFARGVFLPQVPVEYQWNLEQYLENLCRKARLPNDAYLEGAKLEWFTAQVFGEEK